jgi:hypothetical protein
VQRFLRRLFSSPLIRRVGWHLSRVRSSIDRRFFAQLLIGAFTLVLIVASLITIVEKPLIFSSLGASVNGGVQTILPGRLVVCHEPEYREHVGSGDVEPRRHQRPDERS